MKINKTIQSLAKNISANKNIRPNLAGVYFNGNKAVATDSYKLMEIEIKNESELNPEIRNFEYSSDFKGIIQQDDITEIKIPKLKNYTYNFGFIGNISEKNNADGSLNVSIATTNIDKSNVVNTRTLNGKFPDYESFFPKESELSVGMDISHLEDILKVYKSSGVKSLKFDFNKQQEPIVIKPHGGDIDESIESMRAILMPIKL